MISAKQKEFAQNANARINLKIGARRCGKTYLDVLWRIPYKIRELHGKAGLYVILGVSKATIERNVLEPMREIYGKQFVKFISSDNTAILFGERVYCLGAEKVSQVSKIQGTSIKYCYCDELAKHHRDVFEMLKGSLDKPYSMLDGALNPEKQNHWLKETFIDKIEEAKLDVYLQHYTIFDNPFLSKDFVDNFCKEMKAAGDMWYRRLVLGEWCDASGLIYPNFSKEQHVLESFTPSDNARYYIAVDYGTYNPFAAGLWCIDGAKAVMIAEYYYNGREKSKQKTDEEYYAELETLADGRLIQAVIIDPSASSFIETVRRHGQYNTRKAVNDVLDGIMNASTLLGASMIQFDKHCTATIKEFGSYSWDEKADGDKPLKTSDHSMDQMRYFCSTILKREFKWAERNPI